MSGGFRRLGELGSGRGLGAGIAVAIGAGSIWQLKSCIFNVEAGRRGIIYNRLSGVNDEIYREGSHFRVPWFDRAILFDVRSRPRTLVSLTGSRDLQMVNISCRVLSRPDPAFLPSLYREVGIDYDEKVLPSIINEVLKSVVAQYNAAELITQREAVSKAIRDQLTRRAKDFYISLDDVSLTHLSFSPEYEKAVERKQVAQQQAERGKYLVLKAQQEKKSTIIKAQGDSEAAKLIGEAVKKNPAFLDLRKLDIAKDIANVIGSSQNKTLLNPDSLLINNIHT